MNKQTILVVDDQPEVRETLRKGLEGAGFRVLQASSRAEMLDIVQTEVVNLVTIDLKHGRKIGLARIRLVMRNVPIIIISGKRSPEDRVIGLESGADDYIIKPFHIREVILRVKRALNVYEHELPGQNELRFDGSKLDLTRRIVKHLDGSPVELTGIQLDLLALFVRHPGRILTRDEISRAILGHDWAPLDRTIDGHVARLRRKIEPSGDGPSLIRSVRGVGYVFAGEVRPAPEAT